MAVETTRLLPITTKASARWLQLGLGLIAMMAISSPQYVWTLFTKPFQDNLGATLPAVPDHLLAADRAADLAVAAARLSRRTVRPPLADRVGLPSVRRRLGVVVFSHHPVRALSDLWPVLRYRLRYRLFRHHRLDGSLDYRSSC